MSPMANHTLIDTTLPSLPIYSMVPQGDFISWLPDFWVSLWLPIIVYWVQSMFFHLLDVYDVFPQYRLHTPEEITRRNHVSRYEVARDVIIQQIIQVATGAVLALTEPQEMAGRGEYDVARWATRIRLAQRYLPGLLSFVGLNATALSKKLSTSYPFLAGALAGGYYPVITSSGTSSPTFAPWELAFGKFIYWVGVPALQFLVAICILDTWQYFLHRLMHVNRWLYSESAGRLRFKW